MDWLDDRRLERKKQGVWKDEDVPDIFPLGNPHEELIRGNHASKKWKSHFSIKRKYAQDIEIF